MSRNREIIGACFGCPDEAKTFSGVALYLFGEMSRRRRIHLTLSTKDIRVSDLFSGAVDFSKIKRYGRPGMSESWCWKPSTVEKMSKRFNDRLTSIVDCKAVLQIGTHVRITRPELKHYCFTDMTIAQVSKSPSCKYFSIGELNKKQLTDAIGIQKSIFENCQGVFVNSNWAKQSVVDDYGINADKVHVVGVGTSVDFDEVIDFENKTHDILFIGREWQRKGGPLLLDAFKLIKEKIEDATLTIIGCSPKVDIPGVKVLGILNKKLDQDRMIFDQTIRRSSVLCVPSNIEPYGICFLESQLYGVVPITFSGEGRSDAIKNGITGVLIDNRSPIAVSGTIIDLLSDPDKMREMGSAGHDYVKNNLRWENVANRVLAVIDSDMDFLENALALGNVPSQELAEVVLDQELTETATDQELDEVGSG